MGSYGPIIQCLLGTGDETDDTKTDEFSEKFQREGGGGGEAFSIQNFMLQIFGQKFGLRKYVRFY